MSEASLGGKPGRVFIAQLWQVQNPRGGDGGLYSAHPCASPCGLLRSSKRLSYRLLNPTERVRIPATRPIQNPGIFMPEFCIGGGTGRGFNSQNNN